MNVHLLHRKLEDHLQLRQRYRSCESEISHRLLGVVYVIVEDLTDGNVSIPYLVRLAERSKGVGS
jgi:hypothetical protein